MTVLPARQRNAECNNRIRLMSCRPYPSRNQDQSNREGRLEHTILGGRTEMTNTGEQRISTIGRVLKALRTAGLIGFTLSAVCASPAAAESLPVCAKCLNPRVISKTGAGTAAAAAEAKVTAEDAAAWCAVNMPRYTNCVRFEVQQGGDGARTSYRATANCSAGQLHSMNGGDYTYSGIWNEGAGRGQPNFRDPGGNIPRWESIRSGTGKARAEWDLFGGLSLAGQWKVLCGDTAPLASAALARTAVNAAGGEIGGPGPGGGRMAFTMREMR
jgi:hypothetical protein